MALPIVIVTSGGIAITESTNGIGLPVVIADNGFGIACRLVDSGGLAVLGGSSGPPVVLPTAPVLAMDPAWTTADNEPDFTIDVDDTVVAGDDVQLQVAVAGTSFAAPVSDTTHEITAPEDVANEIDLALAALPNAAYEARANVTDGVVTSNWSNTVSFTIAATSSAGTNVYPYLLV